jgi:hypothetical protein
MSELYIYDDDLVEDYNMIETFTKNAANLGKESKKEKQNEKVQINQVIDNTNTNKEHSKTHSQSK